MTTPLSDFTAQVDLLLSASDDELPFHSRITQTTAALERYSRDLPNELIEDVAGDGGRYYPLATSLDFWSEGFSRIVSIEYPAVVIANDDTPTYIEGGDWDDDYWAGGIRYLYLPNHSPAATETMRIRYTTPYTPTEAAYDTPPIDFNAICYLAAGLCCQAIATKYARTSDNSITADSVDHSGRSARFRQAMKDFFALYEEHIGLRKGLSGDGGGSSGGVVPPGAEFVSWETSRNGRGYLYNR